MEAKPEQVVISRNSHKGKQFKNEEQAEKRTSLLQMFAWLWSHKFIWRTVKLIEVGCFCN